MDKVRPKATLYNHGLVTLGKLILQDKSSCFPAEILCQALRKLQRLKLKHESKCMVEHWVSCIVKEAFKGGVMSSMQLQLLEIKRARYVSPFRRVKHSHCSSSCYRLQPCFTPRERKQLFSRLTSRNEG